MNLTNSPPSSLSQRQRRKENEGEGKEDSRKKNLNEVTFSLYIIQLSEPVETTRWVHFHLPNYSLDKMNPHPQLVFQPFIGIGSSKSRHMPQLNCKTKQTLIHCSQVIVPDQNGENVAFHGYPYVLKEGKQKRRKRATQSRRWTPCQKKRSREQRERGGDMTNRGKKLRHRRNLLAVQEREGASLGRMGISWQTTLPRIFPERKFPTADECRDFIKLYSQFAEWKPRTYISVITWQQL